MYSICFFSAKPYIHKIFTETNADFNFKMKFYDFNISEDNANLAKGSDVVCLFVNDKLNRNIINILKNIGVKLIALRCAGFNAVDLIAAKELGMPVVRVPAYSPYAVAEHAFALLLTINRKTHRAYNRTRDLNFDINGLLGFDLHSKTIGVIGTGKIGQIFIKIAKGFGMNVLAYDPFENKEAANELKFIYCTLDELYKNSNIIALHCPLTPQTHYLINDESIQKMKEGVYIINTSRGALINTKDLILSIKSKKIGAVALDVYEEEEKYFFEDKSLDSMIEDDVLSRLLSFNNVLVTSHQAFFTEEALSNIAITTLNNIKSYLVDNKLINSV